jgi:hypothetical protein
LSEYQWNVGVWMGNGALTTFNLPTGKPARLSSTAKVWDFQTGAARAGAWDTSENADVFTPSVTLEADRVLVVTYQLPLSS